MEKLRRWEETVSWAAANGCSDIVAGIPDHDFYYVENPSNYLIGPMGGPMYRLWDFQLKDRPPTEQLQQHFSTLLSHWPQIVGQELADITRPLMFTGEKARRLLVYANPKATPPWGDWSHLSPQESQRRTFTHFRAAINKAISPHEVDHVDFTTEAIAEPGGAPDRPAAGR